MTWLLFVLHTYSELFSLVTAYKRECALSRAMPVTPILLGHLFPNTMESFKTRLSFFTSNRKIIFWFPADAYKYLLSALNCRPTHAAFIFVNDNNFFFWMSISSIPCAPFPLSVIATY